MPSSKLNHEKPCSDEEHRKFLKEQGAALDDNDDYVNLPISWEGAPEFQWKYCEGVEEGRLLIIDNILPADLYDPWLYCVMLRARETALNFSQIFTNHNAKDSFGRIEMLFPDEHAGGIPSYAVNYLVYIRTPNRRSIRIFLPQSQAMLDMKTELLKRLGRVREPTISMRRLVLKPVNPNITEQDIRKTFKDHEFETVEFVTDALRSRCAIITFSTAARAIAAHCINSYIFIGEVESGQWIKVLYDAVAYKDRGDPEYFMLTRSEQRVIKENRKIERARSGYKKRKYDDNDDDVESRTTNYTTNDGNVSENTKTGRETEDTA